MGITCVGIEEIMEMESSEKYESVLSFLDGSRQKYTHTRMYFITYVSLRF